MLLPVFLAGVLVLLVDGRNFFGAFDLVLHLVVAGGDVFAECLRPAGVPLPLHVYHVLRLRAAKDRAGQWIEIGHDRSRAVGARICLYRPKSGAALDVIRL